jgi:hypothetical protein
MMIHVNYVSFASLAVIASMWLQWCQQTFETLILVLCEVLLAAVEEGYETFVSFAKQRLKIATHSLRHLLFIIHF